MGHPHGTRIGGQTSGGAAARMHGGTIGAGRQIGLRDGNDGCHENGSDPSWLELAELSATISKSSDFAAQDLNLN